MKEKLAWLLAHSGEASNSHAYRETRALFNHFPRRELLYADAASLERLIDRMVYMAGDNEIVVATRQAPGYVAVLDRVLRSALLAQGGRGPEGGARRGVRSDLVQHVGRPRRHRAAALLLRRIDARASDRRRRGARHHRARDLDVGGPGRRHPRADVRSARRPPPVQALRTHRHAQRALSRVDEAGGSAATTSSASRRSKRSSRRACAPTRRTRRR